MERRDISRISDTIVDIDPSALSGLRSATLVTDREIHWRSSETIIKSFCPGLRDISPCELARRTISSKQRAQRFGEVDDKFTRR